MWLEAACRGPSKGNHFTLHASVYRSGVHLQVTFETTPLMPTYLLALCTGRLKGKTVSSQHNRNITAWGPPSLEEIGEVDVALGVSPSPRFFPFISYSDSCTVDGVSGAGRRACRGLQMCCL